MFQKASTKTDVFRVASLDSVGFCDMQKFLGYLNWRYGAELLCSPFFFRRSKKGFLAFTFWMTVNGVNELKAQELVASRYQPWWGCPNFFVAGCWEIYETFGKALCFVFFLPGSPIFLKGILL